MARLEWDAEREGCMGADRFGDEVAARVGRIVFDDEAPATVRVVVGEEEGEATVRIEMRGTWSTDEGRNTRVALRVFRDAACDEARSRTRPSWRPTPSPPTPRSSRPPA
ncbi:MAG TPA: hypothetical protein RMH26_03320, partial [Polyangiaceae bacterium LLY-WYZ-15_(1-7)]|nr:hypothetical protein [Polyangiaceae bacterium LLY-WYZ-15_(1-7)]